MNDPTKGARDGGSTITGGQTGFEGVPHDGRGLNASWPGTQAQGVMFVITLPAEAVRHDLYPDQGCHGRSKDAYYTVMTTVVSSN